MEGAGDGRSPYVPPGQFAVWRREDPVDHAAPHDMMDIVKQMIVNDPEKVHPLTHGNSLGLAEIMAKLEPNQRYPCYEDDDDDDDEYVDLSDEYDDEDESDYGNTYCGFQRAFLTSQTPPKPASSNQFFNFKMPLQHTVTPEQAEKNANELVAEEERMKNKAEKKKLKKQRQKDRKRQQKLEEEELKSKKKEIKNDRRNETEKDSGDVSSIKELEIEKKKEGVSMSSEKGPPLDVQHKSPSKNSIKAAAPPQLESASSEETEESEEEEDPDREELEADLDMDSSFVNQVWRKVESKPKVEKKENIIKKERPFIEKSPEKLPEKLKGKKNVAPKHTVEGINPLQQCMEFADLGNRMASGGHFAAAIVYFTEAIKLNPRDYRLFGNRSYCWERNGHFNEAMGDAEVSVGLKPTFIKGYFRKGKALMGMKNYTNAILAFKHILQEDSTHVEAAFELKECERLIQLARLNSGNLITMPDLVPPDFRLPSSVGQKVYGKVESAFGGLSLNGSHASSPGRDGAVFITTSGQIPPKDTKEPARAAPQSITQFTPSQLYPVWVGNVTPRITGEILVSHFQRFGAIHSVRILYDRTCAFINYPRKEAAEAAFSALQGAEMEGTKLALQLRHPDHATATVAVANGRQTAKEGVKLPADMECHFWRNAGCTNGEKCRFRHMPENRGIDAK